MNPYMPADQAGGYVATPDAGYGGYAVAPDAGYGGYAAPTGTDVYGQPVYDPSLYTQDPYQQQQDPYQQPPPQGGYQ